MYMFNAIDNLRCPSPTHGKRKTSEDVRVQGQSNYYIFSLSAGLRNWYGFETSPAPSEHIAVLCDDLRLRLPSDKWRSGLKLYELTQL